MFLSSLYCLNWQLIGFSCLSFGLLGFVLNGFELVANSCLGFGFEFWYDGSGVEEGVLSLSFGLLSCWVMV